MFGRSYAENPWASAWLGLEGQVYSLASDFAYAQQPWLQHRVLELTPTSCLVDWQGQPRSIDRNKLVRDGWAIASGVCFYAETLMRRISAEWSSLETSVSHVRPVSHSDETDLLGLGPNYTRAEVMASFRRCAFEMHPDRGGDSRKFGRLMEARTRALARARG